MVNHDMFIEILQLSFGVRGVLFCRGLNDSCVTAPRLSALWGRCHPDLSCLVVSRKAVSLDLYYSWSTVLTSKRLPDDAAFIRGCISTSTPQLCPRLWTTLKVQQLVDCVDAMTADEPLDEMSATKRISTKPGHIFTDCYHRHLSLVI